ncbi:MAG: hypothetical protein AAGN82_15885 [Myxococcota bacterium]
MRWVNTALMTLFVGAMGAAACSASTDTDGDPGTSGSGAGGPGATGTGADDLSSGSLVGVGGGNTTGGFGGACQAVSEVAQPVFEDADIIFAVDTSGSMGDENEFVRQNLNAFSQQIVNSGIDARVIMLAERPLQLPLPCGNQLPIPFPCPPGICIDPPLGSGQCPADDNPPAYHHPQSEIGSSDALSQIVDLYPSYGSILRANTNKYVVIISDDNARPPNIDDAMVFLNTFTALDPAKLSGVIVHSIYCFDGSGDCVQKGQAYEDLVNLTGGIAGNLALQDFKPIFDQMASNVIANGQIPCEFEIPEPPMGETLDPSKVNVVFTDGNGNETNILQVPNQASCNPNDGGWYYDVPSAPNRVLLCPASCTGVQADPMGKVDVLFGCETQIAPPL